MAIGPCPTHAAPARPSLRVLPRHAKAPRKDESTSGGPGIHCDSLEFLPPPLSGRYADALDGYKPDGFRVRGKTVADVRAELDRRGLKAVYQLWWSYADGGFFPEPVSVDRIKDDLIVESSRAYSSDTIELTVVPGPEAGPAPTPSPRPQWWDLPEEG